MYIWNNNSLILIKLKLRQLRTTALHIRWNWFQYVHHKLFLLYNIPSAPAYGVYVSQLIRYARGCSNYQDFMERGKVLTTKLLSQGYQKNQTGGNTQEVLLKTSWSGQSLQCGSFQNCFWCFCRLRSISRLPKSRTYASTDISFVQAYKVMLTIRGRLITPFILGSMSVGLNILIRHFVYGFMSLDYGLGTMSATTCLRVASNVSKYLV